MGILPDGGSFIAYMDSSDPDPLFGVELMMPDVYGPMPFLVLTATIVSRKN